MKHLIVAGVLFAAAGDAVAQVTEIHTRWGASGSHVNLPVGTQTFGYEATVTGTTTAFKVKLEVYHNATLKFTDTKLVPTPISSYLYSCSVGLGTWGLCAGDTVTFVLRVIDTASGATLATHYLFGDVAGT